MALRGGGGGALLRLMRPGNALVAASGVYVGALLSGAPVAPDARLLLGMLAAVAFAAAGNVRNDISDVDVDRVAHPARPLVTGEVSARAARFLSFVLYAVAVESALLVSYAALALVVLAIPLMELYERRLKLSGLPGNLAIAALTAAPFVLGALVATGERAWPLALDARAPTWSAAVLAVAGLAALATAGREILKDVEDAAADAPRRRTLPHRIGGRGAGLVGGAFLLAAAALSPIPWWAGLSWWYLAVVAVADALFIGAAALAPVAGRAGVAQRVSKLAMVVALVALVLGRVGPTKD